MKQVARFRKSIASVCIALVTLSGGILAYDEIRPYPTRVEFQQIAGRSCKNELELLYQERRVIKRDLQDARAQKNTQWELSLLEDLQDVVDAIARVKRECGWS